MSILAQRREDTTVGVEGYEHGYNVCFRDHLSVDAWRISYYLSGALFVFVIKVKLEWEGSKHIQFSR